ncbi:MAG TPA: hypothetical protein VJ867_16605 [Gemmatimonadaceae bacterium]|nr:hypothetical protein [Gemmatimonadaceae bacterium]
MTTAPPIPRAIPRHASRAPTDDVLAPATPFAWHPPTVVLAALFVMIGVYWDISWHMSIGRDTFWTPAHLLIQAGGLIAGLTSGYVALRTTFGTDHAARASAVTFWGFRAPLGAWVCVWGCLAMVTSAPFDNWWHNAYGLDVRIISPPHTILALGIGAIGVGALLLSAAAQNREARERTIAMWLFIVAGALLLMDRAVMLTEYSGKNQMHGGRFYRAAMLAYPMAIVMMTRASRMKWAGTLTAAIFTGIMLTLMWIIQLFPATPKLGPIYQPITHMVGMAFPALVVVPAVGVDVLLQRGRARPLALAPLISIVFLVLFLAAEWPFASFLMTPAARNWVFNADNFVFWMSPSGVEWSRHWATPEPGAWPMPAQLAIALVVGTISSYVGLWFGTWLARVRR